MLTNVACHWIHRADFGAVTVRYENMRRLAFGGTLRPRSAVVVELSATAINSGRAVQILLPPRFNDASAQSGLAYVSVAPAEFDKFIAATKQTGVASANWKGGQHDPRR